MVQLIHNEVEDYLKENVGKFLSLRTIYRDLKMKRRKALWLIHKSNLITNVEPLDVGCNKKFLHVYTYGEYVSKVNDYKNNRISGEDNIKLIIE